ncbi:MAG: S1 RNA-binding domain-containing protein, partial [bacterium]|nr:S1 RNA-binding domain-containing protein [bacterium]
SINLFKQGEGNLTLSLKNAKKDFELSKDEMIEEYDKDSYKDKIGEEIRVMVVAKNPLRFSEKAMQKVLQEELIIEEIRNGKIFEVEIKSVNKGGLIGKFGSYEVFVPASQVKLGFVKELDKFVGKKLRLKAEKVESRGARRQIVGSQRVILQAEKDERDAIRLAKETEFFESIVEGDVVLGTPVRFASFGAFIDVNGFDCLAHISDLSWTGCNDCAEVLEIGKTYEFKILKIDQENKRVSVGYKQLQPKPWDSVPEKYKVGDVIHGKIVRIVNFGAFVEIEKGIDGLVHVSQISNEWLENPVKALQVGQEIDAKILEINVEKEKINLSIKALLPEAEKPVEEKKEEAPEEVELHEWKDDDNSGVSIADMLNSDK